MIKNFIKKIIPLILFFSLAASASAVTIFTVPQGGTGKGTLTVGECLIGNGTSAITSAPCSSGSVTSVASADGSITVTNPTSTVDLAVVKSPILTTGRTISISGDLTYTSPSFNGSGNVTAAGTLATVNSNVGSFTNASITVNGKGLVTAASSGTAPVTSISGTANRITITGTTTPTIDIAATYVGQSSITTLGTIGTGTWQGTKIGLAFGGTNADLSATGGTSQVLKQSSTGAAITVGQLAASDLSNGTTGTGAIVLANTPTLITPVLGAATYTTLSGGNITDSGLTAGRVTFAGTAGLLSDDADMTFATDTLTVTKIIGATNITTPLLLGGTAAGSKITYQSTTGTGTTTGIAHQWLVGTNGGTTAMTILNNGNVGILTAAPQFPLDIGGNITTATALWAAGSPMVTISGNVNGIAGVEMRNASTGTASDFRFAISDTDTNYISMIMPSVGNTGTMFGLQRNTIAGVITNNQTSGTNTRIMVLGTFNAKDLILGTNSTERMRILAAGNTGIGVANPTAVLHLKAGTASASSAPLKFNLGTNMTTAEAGAEEYDGTNLFFTPTGTIRKSIPTIVMGRQTAQTAADASVVTQTVGAADASYEISMNVLVTTSTVHSFTCTVTYTDEGNTSRTVTLNFSTLAGTLTPTIANATGAAPYEGVPLHIRAKGGTTITLATTGTFTTVTYNVEGRIMLLQ